MISKRLLDLIIHNDTMNLCWLADGKSIEDGAYLEGRFVSYSIWFEDNLEFWAVDENALANSVKEFFIRYGNGYCIMSFIDFDGTWFANVSGSVFKKGFQGTNESEVIFKAAEWIIDLEDANEKKAKDTR